MATYKSYSAGTGGGPPKALDTSPSEDDLLEFLTPEASGMSDIPEGGVLCKTSLQNSLEKNSSLRLPNFTSQLHLTAKKALCTQRLQETTSSSLQNNVNKVINIVLLKFENYNFLVNYFKGRKAQTVQLYRKRIYLYIINSEYSLNIYGIYFIK